MLSADPYAKVIIITGRGEREHALRAVGEGAYDFLYKPVQIDELKVVLKRAFYVSATEVTQAAWEYACRVRFPPAKHFTFVGLRLARTAP